jgi:phosphoglycerate dehydrogenase-like enzyme
VSELALRGPTDILVVLGLTLPEISEQQLADIRAAAPPGSRVRVAPKMRDAIELAPDVEVILGFIPEPLFKAAPKLRWVHAIASGMDAFLYPAMRDSEVVLTGEKGLVGGHLADTGFGLLLALTRQIAKAIKMGPEGWNHREAMRRVELELDGMTMGIVGFGGTGRAFAKRAVAFGMRVIAVDVTPMPGSDGVREVWGMDRLNELLAASDVVAIGAPLTPETRGLFGDKAFDTMKRGALLVNVTRGEVVDGDALVRALQDGRLGGAALDVAPVEPLPADHPLWTLPNVLITPHTAGFGPHLDERRFDILLDNCRRFVAGQPLRNVVDKAAWF